MHLFCALQNVDIKSFPKGSSCLQNLGKSAPKIVYFPP